MGLFNFFKKNQTEAANQNLTAENAALPDIPKDIFVEDRQPGSTEALINSNLTPIGIDSIYAFLQGDYENKGFNDALTNPDDSYKKDNILLIRHDFQILLERVKTYYEDLLKEIDFHISSRSRAGLIDLVEELQTRRQMVVEHESKVKTLFEEMSTGDGVFQRVILSYQRGFMRGLSALSKSNVLNKKL